MCLPTFLSGPHRRPDRTRCRSLPGRQPMLALTFSGARYTETHGGKLPASVSVNKFSVKCLTLPGPRRCADQRRYLPIRPWVGSHDAMKFHRRSANGVEVARDVVDRGWGLLAAIRLPDGEEFPVYQPRHPSPLEP